MVSLNESVTVKSNGFIGLFSRTADSGMLSDDDSGSVSNSPTPKFHEGMSRFLPPSSTSSERIVFLASLPRVSNSVNRCSDVSSRIYFFKVYRVYLPSLPYPSFSFYELSTLFLQQFLVKKYTNFRTTKPSCEFLRTPRGVLK